MTKAEYLRAWRKAHPGKNAEYTARWRKANPAKSRACIAAWAKANPERRRARNELWYAANSEKARARMTAWAKKNREKGAAYAAKRRATIIAATVPLTPQEQAKIVGIYAEARALTEMIGTQYHVDHIIPLSKGGLHHPSNLQVLRAVDNRRKGAKL